MIQKKRVGVLVGAILLGVSNLSLASDGSSGCGAGWYLFKKNSLVSSFSRTITNATFSNTIGMTFGTSNCQRHDIVLQEKMGTYYAEANLDQIQVESALGEGEHLNQFSYALGCDWEVAPRLQDKMRENYQTLFPTSVSATTPSSQAEKASHVVRKVKGLMREDRILMSRCSGIVG
jgi:hypothetical protein